MCATELLQNSKFDWPAPSIIYICFSFHTSPHFSSPSHFSSSTPPPHFYFSGDQLRRPPSATNSGNLLLPPATNSGDQLRRAPPPSGDQVRRAPPPLSPPTPASSSSTFSTNSGDLLLHLLHQL